jgi:hypothetical protein
MGNKRKRKNKCRQNEMETKYSPFPHHVPKFCCYPTACPLKMRKKKASGRYRHKRKHKKTKCDSYMVK